MRLALEKLTGDRKVILLINMGVFILLAYVVSLWVNLAISSRLHSLPAYSAPKASPATPGGKADYSIIKRRNIFNPGSAAVPAAMGPEAAEGAIPTALKVKLLGTIITENSQSNAAVIADAGTNEQKLYRVFDAVAPGATVVRIERFTVYIDNSGSLEVLRMDFDAGFPEGSTLRRTKRGTGTSSGLSGEPVQAIGGDRYLMDHRYLENELKNMNQLMVQVRAVPEKGADGGMVGFKLFQIAKNSIYDKIGLQNDDVLQRVNGQSLDSVEKGLDLFMALKNETHFEVDLLRNDARKTLTVDIQ